MFTNPSWRCHHCAADQRGPSQFRDWWSQSPGTRENLNREDQTGITSVEKNYIDQKEELDVTIIFNVYILQVKNESAGGKIKKGKCIIYAPDIMYTE